MNKLFEGMVSPETLPSPKPTTDIGLLRMIRDMILDHQKDESFFERNTALYLIASFAEEEILSLSAKRR